MDLSPTASALPIRLFDNVQADDVKRVQSQLLAAANATDLDLQTCQKTWMSVRAAWGAYLISVRDSRFQDVSFNSGQMAVFSKKARQSILHVANATC